MIGNVDFVSENATTGSKGSRRCGGPVRVSAGTTTGRLRVRAIDMRDDRSWREQAAEPSADGAVPLEAAGYRTYCWDHLVGLVARYLFCVHCVDAPVGRSEAAEQLDWTRHSFPYGSIVSVARPVGPGRRCRGRGVKNPVEDTSRRAFLGMVATAVVGADLLPSGAADAAPVGLAVDKYPSEHCVVRGSQACRGAGLRAPFLAARHRR